MKIQMPGLRSNRVRLIAVAAILLPLLLLAGWAVWSRPTARVPTWREPTGAWSAMPEYVATADNDRAVDAARRHLEASPHWEPLDYRYKVDMVNGEYWVYVSFIYGYDKSGQPIIVLGGFNTVVVSPQFQVLRVIGGA